MKQEVNVKQHDIADCGPACVSSILAYFGSTVPISQIREKCHTTERGSNILGVVQGLEAFAISGKALKLDEQCGDNEKKEALGELPVPAVAHVVLDKKLHHYVVIYKITQSAVSVMDPAVGVVEKLPIDHFVSIWTGVVVLASPRADYTTLKAGVSPLSRVLTLLGGQKKYIVQSVVGALVFTFFGFSTSIYVEKIVDYVLPDKNENLINLMGLCMIGVLILSTVINTLRTLIMQRVGVRVDAKLVLGFYAHLLQLPSRFFLQMQTGEVVSRIGDAIKIRQFISDGVTTIATNILILIVSFILMFSYYWKLALVVLAVLPVYYMVFWVYDKQNRTVLRGLMETAAKTEAWLYESLSMVPTIKLFGLRGKSQLRTELLFSRMLRSSYKSNVLDTITDDLTTALGKLAIVVMFWVGTYYVFEGHLTAGELFSFYAIISYFSDPLKSMINMGKVFRDARIASERLFELFDLEHEKEHGHIPFPEKFDSRINFSEVTFAYDNTGNTIESLSLAIDSGQITAIVGESGCGKTTLISLLTRLNEINSGSISFGDVNIRHFDLATLRDNIGVVPQRLDLINGSIAENIFLNKTAELDWDRVIELTKAVGLFEFIDALPDGFETNVGCQGLRMSGGQMQRLAIVRALYKNPQIILFDEATSALDSASEQKVKALLAKLKQEGKTIIIIAHRLGTIKNADRIHVMRKGRVIESGTHGELLSKDGEYSKFWTNQI